MTPLRLALAALAAAALPLAAVPAAAEHLAAPALDGFVVGYQAANDEQAIREDVPAGETVEQWTRMVTTQRFGGAAARLTPSDLLESIARNLATTCPGSSSSRVRLETRAGRPAARIDGFCPLLARTGQTEAFLILAIAGDADLHVRQVAFRRVPTASDIAWGEAVLAAVVLCETGQASDQCRPRTG